MAGTIDLSRLYFEIRVPPAPHSPQPAPPSCSGPPVLPTHRLLSSAREVSSSSLPLHLKKHQRPVPPFHSSVTAGWLLPPSGEDSLSQPHWTSAVTPSLPLWVPLEKVCSALGSPSFPHPCPGSVYHLQKLVTPPGRPSAGHLRPPHRPGSLEGLVFP